MANILLAWELGGGYGHVAPLRALAQELVRRGHRCTFAVRDLGTAEEWLEPALGRVLQAPLRLGAIRNPVRVQVSYASLLHNSGFDQPLAIAAALRAWRELIEGHGCDLLVADHAPMAVAAAHGLHTPVLQVGTGFTLPPTVAPYPVFRPQLRVGEEVLRHNESAVLVPLRAAFERLGWTPPSSLQTVFGGGLRALFTYRELDHYDTPRQDDYLGLPDLAQGLAPQWPAGDGPRLFGYLRPSKSLPGLLAALQRLPARVLLRIGGGVTADSLRGYERAGLRIVDQAVDLKRAARDSDALIHYGAHATTAEFLLAGKPALLVPETPEQSLVALRAQQLGAALVPPPKGDFNVSAALRQLLDDAALKRAAESFSVRYADQDRARIVPALIERASSTIGSRAC